LLFFLFGLVMGEEAPPSDFVYTQGTQFMLNGKPFYFAGANSYNVFTFGGGYGDPETQYMDKAAIDKLFQDMENNGVTVLRTWAFNVGQSWHGFEPSLGQYNADEFDEFDYILLSAKNHSLKVIVTLDNYWPDYGGITQRLQWAGASASPNQGVFFTNQKAIDSYTNYLKFFFSRVNHYTQERYVNDSTIFAWELMNEPRHQGLGDDVTSTTLRNWIDNIGQFIRNYDSYHMISAGIEGHGSKYSYGGDEGNNFITIHQSSYISFCTAHPYPTAGWANLNIQQTQQLLIKWQDDCHGVVGKPLVIEEFNVDTSHGSRPDWWKAIYQTIEDNDIAGDCFWWYENSQVDGQYGIMTGSPELVVFKAHSKVMQGKSTK